MNSSKTELIPFGHRTQLKKGLKGEQRRYKFEWGQDHKISWGLFRQSTQFETALFIQM